MVKIVNSLKRGLEVLALFAEQKEPMTVGQISASIGAPISSTAELVHTLCVQGFLIPGSNPKYYFPTSKLYDIGRALMFDAHVHQLNVSLHELHAQLRETCLLLRLESDRLRTVTVLPAPRAFRFAPKAGARFNIPTTASGQAILTKLPNERCRSLLEGIEAIPKEKRIGNIDGFLQQIQENDQRGWHEIDHDSGEIGLTSFAIPLALHNHIYAISVSGPAERLARNHDLVTSSMVAIRRELEGVEGSEDSEGAPQSTSDAARPEQNRIGEAK